MWPRSPWDEVGCVVRRSLRSRFHATQTTLLKICLCIHIFWHGSLRFLFAAVKVKILGQKGGVMTIRGE